MSKSLSRKERYLLKTFFKTLDEKVLNPETRCKGITYAYMVFAGLMLLHHIYVTIYHKTVLTGASVFYIPFILLAGMNFFMGKLWKDKLFYVFLVLFILKVVRTAMFGTYPLQISVTYFVMSVYAYFGCYGIARVIPRNQWKAFLSVLCFLWTIAALVLAGLGIRYSITRIPMQNLGTLEFFTTNEHRLALLYQPVISGIIMSVCMSFAVFGCFLTKNKFLRVFYILASFVFFFTAALTGTRTAYILTGANMALLLYIPLNNLLKPGKNKGLVKNSGYHVLLFLSFLIIAGLVAYLQSQTMNLVQNIQTRGGLLVGTAYAEDEAVIKYIDQRGFTLSSDPDNMLNGRYTLWSNVLEVVFKNAENLLLGQSVDNTMIPVNEIRSELGLHYVYHCHNVYLQHLMENGLPGFLLYCSFILVFLYHAVRLLTDRSLPFWQRILPVTAILCAIEGMIDTTCHVNNGYPQMTLLYLFAGFTIALSRETKKKKDALMV